MNSSLSCSPLSWFFRSACHALWGEAYAPVSSQDTASKGNAKFRYAFTNYWRARIVRGITLVRPLSTCRELTCHMTHRRPGISHSRTLLGPATLPGDAQRSGRRAGSMRLISCSQQAALRSSSRRPMRQRSGCTSDTKCSALRHDSISPRLCLSPMRWNRIAPPRPNQPMQLTAGSVAISF